MHPIHPQSHFKSSRSSFIWRKHHRSSSTARTRVLHIRRKSANLSHQTVSTSHSIIHPYCILWCNVQTQVRLIGAFCAFSFFLISLCGLPIFASCARAYARFAFRCWGVCACDPMKLAGLLLGAPVLRSVGEEYHCGLWCVRRKWVIGLQAGRSEPLLLKADGSMSRNVSVYR